MLRIFCVVDGLVLDLLWGGPAGMEGVSGRERTLDALASQYWLITCLQSQKTGTEVKEGRGRQGELIAATFVLLALSNRTCNT